MTCIAVMQQCRWSSRDMVAVNSKETGSRVFRCGRQDEWIRRPGLLRGFRWTLELLVSGFCAGSCIFKRLPGCFVIESPKWAWGMRMALRRHGMGREAGGKELARPRLEWESGRVATPSTPHSHCAHNFLRRSTKNTQIRRYVGFK